MCILLRHRGTDVGLEPVASVASDDNNRIDNGREGRVHSSCCTCYECVWLLLSTTDRTFAICVSRQKRERPECFLMDLLALLNVAYSFRPRQQRTSRPPPWHRSHTACPYHLRGDVGCSSSSSCRGWEFTAAAQA